MKTTIEIRDDLLIRAKRFAKRRGRPLRAVVEDGLRRVLADVPKRPAYKLEDRSVGEPGQKDPLEVFSWQELRGRDLQHRAEMIAVDRSNLGPDRNVDSLSVQPAAI